MTRHGLGRRIAAFVAAASLLCLNLTVDASATVRQSDLEGTGMPTYVRLADGQTITLTKGQEITVTKPCVASYYGEPGFGYRDVPVTPTRHLKFNALVVLREESLCALILPARKSRIELRALAVAAPYQVCRATDPATPRTLGSRTPFSLQNACRLAAGMAQSGTGVWGASNWNGSDVSANIVMYDYADDLGDFQAKLETVRPNLLLIGTMTLGLPGAIDIAQRAKQLLGDTVTIVLGGKHPSETIYKLKGDDTVHHAAGSPLRLMLEGKVPENFDVVIAGDGEHIVAKLGEMVAEYESAVLLREHLSDLATCPGTWVAGIVKNGAICTVASTGIPIDRDTMPVPATVFGFDGNFPVFDTDRTAHVYSDISRGCIRNCFFCTERQAINGKPNLSNAANRLARQLAAVRESGKESGDRVSAFVEDSILLMGVVPEMNKLHDLLLDQECVPFGGQTTVDLLLHKDRQDAYKALTKVGLEYLFVGLETPNEQVAQTIDKNIGEGDWMVRNEAAVKFATTIGIKYGVSILFGLGESQADRMFLLEEIARWQRTYKGNPCVVSMNWATQHPLFDVGPFDYVEWGTRADSERLPLFQKLFGEASEKYSIARQLPTVAELKEIELAFDRLTLRQ